MKIHLKKKKKKLNHSKENKEMGSSGGSESWELWAGGSKTWIVCQRRLGSAWAGDVKASDGVTKREKE